MAVGPDARRAGAHEWAEIEGGIIERAELLDLVLTDLYGPRELLRRRLIPPEVVLGHPGFLHACDGIRLPGEHQLFNYAADLGRGEDGRLVVLADRTQAPVRARATRWRTGSSASACCPTLYRDAGVHRLAPFFRWLRSALQAVAPADVEDPRIVVLSPGPYNETAFEHAVLASTLGYPLVEGSDLTVRGGSVWMRSLGQREPVHVILRRVDDTYCDPLELNPDSQLGVTGLVQATPRGHRLGGQRARLRRAGEPGAGGLRGGRRAGTCSAARCACPRCRPGGAATRRPRVRARASLRARAATHVADRGQRVGVRLGGVLRRAGGAPRRIEARPAGVGRSGGRDDRERADAHRRRHRAAAQRAARASPSRAAPRTSSCPAG